MVVSQAEWENYKKTKEYQERHKDHTVIIEVVHKDGSVDVGYDVDRDGKVDSEKHYSSTEEAHSDSYYHEHDMPSRKSHHSSSHSSSNSSGISVSQFETQQKEDLVNDTTYISQNEYETLKMAESVANPFTNPIGQMKNPNNIPIAQSSYAPNTTTSYSKIEYSPLYKQKIIQTKINETNSLIGHIEEEKTNRKKRLAKYNEKPGRKAIIQAEESIIKSGEDVGRFVGGDIGQVAGGMAGYAIAGAGELTTGAVQAVGSDILDAGKYIASGGKSKEKIGDDIYNYLDTQLYSIESTGMRGAQILTGEEKPTLQDAEIFGAMLIPVGAKGVKRTGQFIKNKGTSQINTKVDVIEKPLFEETTTVKNTEIVRITETQKYVNDNMVVNAKKFEGEKSGVAFTQYDRNTGLYNEKVIFRDRKTHEIRKVEKEIDLSKAKPEVIKIESSADWLGEGRGNVVDFSQLRWRVEGVESTYRIKMLEEGPLKAIMRFQSGERSQRVHHLWGLAWT